MQKPEACKKTNNSHFTSSSAKIFIQLVWLTTLVILPMLFPEIIQLRYKTPVTINILLAFSLTIVFEFLKIVCKKLGKSYKQLVNFQLLVSLILLSWFLHLFGRINGPFFFLYLLNIMESAFSMDIQFINIMVAIAAGSTVYEFTYLALTHEIQLNLFFTLQLGIRLIALFFMRSYGLLLGKKISSERRSKEKIRLADQKVQNVTDELRKTNARLRKMSALKDEFVSLTSHELRTPLTAISGSLSTVLEGYAGKIDTKTRGFLDGAYNESLRLLRLVNNLLNISRIELGRLKFDMEKLNLLSATTSAVEALKTQVEEKKIELVFEADKDLTVNADQDKLREVFINLISNAIKYTDKGRIAITVWKQGGTAIISVEDSGRGILFKDQKKLFKKFERVDSIKAAKKKGGTGLGLYICRNLIEGMGGEIWLQSEHGKGTTIFFTLPLV